MATSAISAGDLSNLRADQYIDNLALHITPLTVVQTGTISTLPSLTPYISLTWDGSTSGIEVGQMVKITNGTTLRAYATIPKAPSGSTLYISATPLGSPGAATRVESPLQVGDTVTVYNHHPLWNLYSRIADETFFKFWDQSYTNQNSQPPPVCNVGTWQAAILGSGESTARFTIPRGGSDTSFAMGSATISSSLYTLPSGVTIVSGYALTDNVIEVDATAGSHLIKRTITDSNTNTHTAYLWLFVDDGTVSLSNRYGIEITGDNQTRNGREMTFTITGDSLQDVLYPGAGICFRWWGKYNNTDLTDGVLVDTFVGYIHNEGLDFSHDGNIGTASFRAVSPYLYAEKVGQPTQSLEEVTSPGHWAECTSALSNPRGYLYYAMYWHCPNIVAMHDIDDNAYTTPRRQFAQFNTNNLAAAMKVSADYIAGNVGSASDGTTVLRKYPLYMSNADRNSLATVITWQEQDLSRLFQYRKRMGSAFAESRTGAFTYDGTKTSAWLAGKRWHQGVGKTELSYFSVTVSEGVSRIKEVAGHYLAEQNADIEEIPLELNAAQDVVDPVYLLWNKLTVSATFDPNGVGFSAERMLPISVSRDWQRSNGDWLPKITLSLQPETFGQPGEEIPIPSAKSYISGGWSSSLPVLYTPYDDNAGYGALGLVLANDDNGKLAVCRNYYTNSLTWVDLSENLDSETVCDFCLDYNSAYYTGNNSNAALGVYALTIAGTSLNVWYFSSIVDSNSATKLTTYTMSDSSCDSEARIEVSEATPTYVAISWHDQTGVEFAYSNDGGSTWQSKANVGSTVTDTANDNAALGLAVDGNNTLITAPDATPEYGIYLATTVGGAFSALANTVRSSTPQPTIKIISATDTSYVADIGASGFTIDFDSGFSGYTLSFYKGASDTGTVTIQETATGNPGDAAQIDFSANLYTAAGRVNVDMGASYNVTDIQFDIKYDQSASEVRVAVESVINTADYGLYYDATPPASGSWYTHTATTDFFSWSPFTAQTFIVRVATGALSSPFTGTWYIDNIIITVAGSGTTSLYKVSDFDGTDSWSDVTPAAGEAPDRPHDLAIDLIDTSVLDTVSGVSNNWYSSSDSGGSWSTSESSSAKRAFLTAGDTLLEGGNAEVKISYDGGTSFNDATGNLASIWGSVGVIKRVQAL